MAKTGKNPLTVRTSLWIPLFWVVLLNLTAFRLLTFMVYVPDLLPQISTLVDSITGWNILWTALLFILAIGASIYLYLYWLNNYYVIGQDQVVHVQGVFWKRRLTLRFPSLDKLVVRQGFLGKIFHFGTLTILSTETGESIQLKNIPHPARYSAYIKQEFPGPERL